MATITPVATHIANPVDSGNISVSVPNVQVDDWLLVWHAASYETGAMNAPTGAGSGTYSQIGVRGGTAQNENYDCTRWRKVCTSGGTHVVTATAQYEQLLVVRHIRNADAIDGNPSHASAPQTVSTTNLTIPAVSPSTSDAMLYGQWGGIQFNGPISGTPPSGMTEIADVPHGSLMYLQVCEQQLSASGSTGARTAVANRAPANGWAGQLFAVSGKSAPAPPASSVEPGRFLLAY